jgi:hypothetical protein
MEYLELSLSEYTAAEDNFNKAMAPYFDHERAPVLQLKITIDKAEIRPDDIDDWSH